MSSDIARLLVCDGIPYFFLDECPSEFMGYGIQKAKCYKNKLLASIDDHSELYGVSVYSLWLYDLLKEQGKMDISFIKQSAIDIKLLEKIVCEKILELLILNRQIGKKEKLMYVFMMIF